jgi:hypothetical protein
MISVRNFLKNYWFLLLVVAFKFILQYLLVNPYYELHRDEFLHLDQADHMAFGYISVPPLTSVFSKMIFLLGGDIFWIRFFPALFGALTIIFAWLITDLLNGGMPAKILVSLALLFSALVRLNNLFQPNSFDILAWNAALYFFLKLLRSGDPLWFYPLALALVSGFYNKYTVVFLAAGMLISLMLSPQRKLLGNIHFIGAAILGLILVLPNIMWQVKNSFPVVDHMKALKEYQLDNNSVMGFVTGQARILVGSLPLAIIGLIALFAYRPFINIRPLGICIVFVFLLFAYFKAKDYYSYGLYPALFAVGGVWAGKLKKCRNMVLISLIIINLLIFSFVAKYVMPSMSPGEIIRNHAVFEKIGLLRWEDGKNHQLPQDFADMTGWKEMAEKALNAYRMIPPDELDQTLVFCDNYGQTGAVNYYNRGKMKEAYSFNTDYIYWLPEMDHIKNVILIGEKTDDRIAAMFKGSRQTGVVENQYAREKGTGIFLYSDADSSFTRFFYAEAERRRSNLDIF